MLHEVRDESDGLDGLPQTHLVSQDPVQVVVVKRDQPLQTFDLKMDEDETQPLIYHDAQRDVSTSRGSLPGTA